MNRLIAGTALAALLAAPGAGAGGRELRRRCASPTSAGPTSPPPPRSRPPCSRRSATRPTSACSRCRSPTPGSPSGDIDVFLGNWMPTMEADIAPYREAGTVETVRTNLEGAKYTLAVSTSLAEKGLKDFADIAGVRRRARQHDLRHRARQRRQPADPGHDRSRPVRPRRVRAAVETSEQGMLAQAARAQQSGEGIVFLGWEPHPMNANFEMTYLTGGDEVFGPNFGGATVAHQHPRRLRRGMPERRASSCRTSCSRSTWRTRSWARSSTTARTRTTRPRPG